MDVRVDRIQFLRLVEGVEVSEMLSKLDSVVLPNLEV